MNPDRWRRLQPILDRALELSGEERARYLEAACSGEPQLRADLDRILAADATEGGVLEAPTGAFLDNVRREVEAEQTRTQTQRLAEVDLEQIVREVVRERSHTPSSAEVISDAHGRFLPGAMLANRYRIVARLGRGGMGEVYRVDDLKIGQAVALKFLPEGLDRDPRFLDRLLSAVLWVLYVGLEPAVRRT